MAKKSVMSSKDETSVVPSPVPPQADASMSEEPKQEDGVTTKFDQLNDKLNTIANDLKSAAALVKVLQKEYHKVEKALSKKGAKREQAKREPSGFAKPTRLSNDLCTFLQLPVGTLKARTEVTKMINKYIKAHSLQKPEDRRNFIPDEPLMKILNLQPGQSTSYFKLQTHLRPHFVSAV